MTPEEVAHIAKLAHLSFSSAELCQLGDELNGILALADRLGQLDLDGIEPWSLAMSNVMREDKVETLSEKDRLVFRNDVFDAAPEVESGMFKIPPVVEKS